MQIEVLLVDLTILGRKCPAFYLYTHQWELGRELCCMRANRNLGLAEMSFLVPPPLPLGARNFQLFIVPCSFVFHDNAQEMCSICSHENGTKMERMTRYAHPLFNISDVSDPPFYSWFFTQCPARNAWGNRKQTKILGKCVFMGHTFLAWLMRAMKLPHDWAQTNFPLPFGHCVIYNPRC